MRRLSNAGPWQLDVLKRTSERKPTMKNTPTSTMTAGGYLTVATHLGHGNVEVTLTSAELLNMTDDELVERLDHLLTELEMMLNEQPEDSDGSDVFLSVPPNMNIGFAADILAYCMSMYPNNDVSFYQGPLDLRRNYVDNTISLVVTRKSLKNANVSELVEYIRRYYPEYALQLSVD